MQNYAFLFTLIPTYMRELFLLHVIVCHISFLNFLHQDLSISVIIPIQHLQSSIIMLGNCGCPWWHSLLRVSPPAREVTNLVMFITVHDFVSFNPTIWFGQYGFSLRCWVWIINTYTIARTALPCATKFRTAVHINAAHGPSSRRAILRTLTLLCTRWIARIC